MSLLVHPRKKSKSAIIKDLMKDYSLKNPNSCIWGINPSPSARSVQYIITSKSKPDEPDC